MKNEKQKKVDNTETTMTEGGDMKVSEPKVKEEKPKKQSLKQEDGSYKVNLSETDKTEKDAIREDVSTDKKSAKKEKYTLHIKKVIIKRLALAVADGIMSVDGKNIYTAKDLKVGLFKSEK